MTNALVWVELAREKVFHKFSQWVDRVRFRLPSGEEQDYYVRHSGHPVCAMALTSEGQVILAKQFRPGPKIVLHELPGGGREEGETPEAAMARELLEETGYVGDIQFVTRCLDCAYSDCDRYCFVATDCRKVAEPKPDAHEFIQVVLLPLDEFRTLLRSGRLTDAEVAYLALDHLGLL